MRKYLALILSIWMVFATSCALKDLAFGVNSQPVITNFEYASGLHSEVKATVDFCEDCVEAEIQQLGVVTIDGGQSFPDLPLFSGAFFSLLWLSVRKEPLQLGSTPRPVGNTFNLPLYLRLRKIQVYN